MISSHLQSIMKPKTRLLLLQPNIFKWIPTFSNLFKELILNRNQMFDYFDAQIKEHQLNLKNLIIMDENYEPKDYVEAYLLEIQKRQTRIANNETRQLEDEFYW